MLVNDVHVPSGDAAEELEKAQGYDIEVPAAEAS